MLLSRFKQIYINLQELPGARITSVSGFWFLVSGLPSHSIPFLVFFRVAQLETVNKNQTRNQKTRNLVQLPFALLYFL